MTNYSNLTRSQIEKACAKAGEVRDAICSEMIEAGRGRELSSETFAKARAANADDLSIRFSAASQTCASIHDEMQTRRTYHGSLRRIKISAQ